MWASKEHGLRSVPVTWLCCPRGRPLRPLLLSSLCSADNGSPWLRKRVTLCTAGRPWPGFLESHMDTSCPCQTDHLLMNTLLPRIINPDSPSGRPLRPPGPARKPCVLGGEGCVRTCASISPLGRAHWPSDGGAAGRVAMQDFYSDLQLSGLLGTCTWCLYYIYH